MYHVSSEFYPAGRVLVTKTIPTLLESESLGTDRKQRLSTNIGFRGLTVNFYSRIVAVNIVSHNKAIATILAKPVPVRFQWSHPRRRLDPHSSPKSSQDRRLASQCLFDP